MSDPKRDLLLSILAMDSYNRGYNAGLELPDVEGLKIGAASIDTRIADILDFQQEAFSTGFYAISYKLGNETIISYRGTDGLLSIPFWPDQGSDVWNGYGIGAGSPWDSMPALSRDFLLAIGLG